MVVEYMEPVTKKIGESTVSAGNYQGRDLAMEKSVGGNESPNQNWHSCFSLDCLKAKEDCRYKKTKKSKHCDQEGVRDKDKRGIEFKKSGGQQGKKYALFGNFL